MHTSFKSMLILLLLVSVSACSKENTAPVKTENPPAIAQEAAQDPRTIKQEQVADQKVVVQQGEPAKEVPFDYASMTDAVLIQFDEEPRIQSPINTLLAPRTYDYTIFFKESMNRNSVEAALLKNAEEVPKGTVERAVSSLTFQWTNDRQLGLTVEVKHNEQAEIYSREYTLSVKGARTAGGTLLENPPEFRAILQTPDQIWRLSVDGQTREVLTSFKDPYWFESLDENGDYYLLSRFQRFCACDAGYPKLYSIYDAAQKKITPYSVHLTTNYLGNGNFVADKRGFFYAEADSGSKLTESPFAVKVRRDGYIYGANFSRDHDMLIFAAGREGNDKDPQIVIRNLKTGSEQIIGSPKGSIPRELLNGNIAGVRFYDDGQNVYFALRSELGQGEYTEKRYMFSWKTKQLKTWNPPIESTAWSSFTQSSDRMYQTYVNGGIFKGVQKVADDIYHGGVWIPGTHLFAKGFLDDNPPSNSNPTVHIELFDADKKESRTIASQLPNSTQVIGASPDGKWIYLSSMQSLPGSQ